METACRKRRWAGVERDRRIVRSILSRYGGGGSCCCFMAGVSNKRELLVGVVLSVTMLLWAEALHNVKHRSSLSLPIRCKCHKTMCVFM